MSRSITTNNYLKVNIFNHNFQFLKLELISYDLRIYDLNDLEVLQRMLNNFAVTIENKGIYFTTK